MKNIFCLINQEFQLGRLNVEMTFRGLSTGKGRLSDQNFSELTLKCTLSAIAPTLMEFILAPSTVSGQNTSCEYIILLTLI